MKKTIVKIASIFLFAVLLVIGFNVKANQKADAAQAYWFGDFQYTGLLQ